MNINRHNYETFFILYMDNELEAADRKQVEDFVQLHPDLKDELELLLQFRLTPDENIVFTEKSTLLKGDTSRMITLQNYEEYLLLYIDNELNAASSSAVEEFVGNNPFVKKELDQLKYTRIQPEKILFPDKKSLYRKEEKVHVLYARWWRAIAAILILGIGISTALYMNNKKRVTETARAVPVKKEMPQPAITPENMVPETTVAISDLATQNQPRVLPKQINNLTTNSKGAGIGQGKDNQPVQQQNIQTDLVNNNDRPDNNLPKPDQNPFVAGNTPDKSLAQSSPKTDNNDTKNSLTNSVVTNASPVPSDGYKTAVVLEDEEGGKKSKLRGFLRKVTRTFEKRTNIDPTNDDNRLLVGGLSIKLK